MTLGYLPNTSILKYDLDSQHYIHLKSKSTEVRSMWYAQQKIRLSGHLQKWCWSSNCTVFCQDFSIRMYPGRHCGSCFMRMNVILTVPVDVLHPWLQGHLQAQCWSANWIMLCQKFSIHMYSGRHCGSYFMRMNVIFTVLHISCVSQLRISHAQVYLYKLMGKPLPKWINQNSSDYCQ